MIDSHSVELSKALYNNGLKRTCTFLARWALLAILCHDPALIGLFNK